MGKWEHKVTFDSVRFLGTALRSIRKSGGSGMPKAKPPYLKNQSGHIDQNKQLWFLVRNKMWHAHVFQWILLLFSRQISNTEVKSIWGKTSKYEHEESSKAYRRLVYLKLSNNKKKALRNYQTIFYISALSSL